MAQRGSTNRAMIVVIFVVSKCEKTVWSCKQVGEIKYMYLELRRAGTRVTF